MKAPIHLAILGATGAVGVEVLKTLEKRNFPVRKLTLLASERSAGKSMKFKGEALKVQQVKSSSFEGVDIAIFSAGATRSREFAPHAQKAGAVVVDNSSAFRMDPSVPLVVPEVNGADVANHHGIIANPNCSAAIMVVPLWPLHQRAGIRRIVVSTYQAASGAGAKAMAELESQARDVLAGKPANSPATSHQGCCTPATDWTTAIPRRALPTMRGVRCVRRICTPRESDCHHRLESIGIGLDRLLPAHRVLSTFATAWRALSSASA